jgi:hypothetical protein
MQHFSDQLDSCNFYLKGQRGGAVSESDLPQATPHQSPLWLSHLSFHRIKSINENLYAVAV